MNTLSIQKTLSILIVLLFSVTTLYALRGPVKGRTTNRDLQKRVGHSKWAKCTAKDSDPILRSEAVIEVDVDFFTEPQPRQGTDYLAWSYAYGLVKNSEYECYASVPNDDDGVHKGTADGFFSVGATAADFDWWDTVNAEEALALCTAWVKANIRHAAPDDERYPDHEFYIMHKTHANAYKFAKKGES